MSSPAPNERIGPYQLITRLGAGGMGEVWKARDTRLDRLVALKFSQQDFSDRFAREARAIAQLNHPNVCTLHDVGPNYLVMEFVDGQRIKGPLPLSKVIEYASQICDALDAAHRSGITHRDLKPGNILVAGNRVKLLDFGIARLNHTRPPNEVDETLTDAVTGPGMVLGTPQYMAPEQISGSQVDSRTDVFALGCVIYELITGRRAFEGKSASTVAAAILTKDPEPLEPVQPMLLEQIVRTCLAKDPEHRFQTARDVKLALQWVPASHGDVPRPVSRWVWPLAALAAAGIAMVALAFRPAAPAPEPMRVPFTAPGFRSAEQFIQTPVPSPNGDRLLLRVFDSSGLRKFAVLSLKTGVLTPLAGTEDSDAAFWSADGDFVGFHSAGKLRRVGAAGGNPETVAESPRIGEASWNHDGDVLFAPNNRTPLFLLRPGRGAPEQVTTLDSSRAENSHRSPVFLPDGHHFLFVARSAKSEHNCVWLGTLGSKEVKRLDGLTSTAEFAAVTGSKGWLVYGRDGTVFARWFDAEAGTFHGSEQRLIERVGYSPSGAMSALRVSAGGRVLVYSEVNRSVTVVQTRDRTGQLIRQYKHSGEIVQVRLSPDERSVLFSRPDDKTGNRDLWLLDLQADTISRLTTHPANDWWGTWGADSRTVFFGSDRDTSPGFRVFIKRILEPGAGEERIHPENPFSPLDVSRDGRWILGLRYAPELGNGISITDTRSGGEAHVLLDSEFNEPYGRISPDGQWLAYMSDENGRYEAYVRRISGGRLDASPRIAVSGNGGLYPAWEPGGQELYFLAPDRMLYAVRFGPGGPAGHPAPLFRLCGSAGYAGEGTGSSWHMPYDVYRGGKQFLVQCRSESESAQPFYMFRDWQATLKH